MSVPLLDPSITPWSSHFWRPPPAEPLPSGSPPASHSLITKCNTPLAALPRLLPRFIDGAGINAQMQGVLDGIQSANPTVMVKVNGVVTLPLVGSYTMSHYSSFNRYPYAGSTAVQLPNVPGTLVVTASQSISGHLVNENDNSYGHPGDLQGEDTFLQVGTMDDSNFITGGNYAFAGLTPGANDNISNGSNIVVNKTDNTDTISTLGTAGLSGSQQSPGWASAGRMVPFRFISNGYAPFAWSLNGTITMTVTLQFAWYEFTSAPAGFDPTAGVHPPSSQLSSQWGGCC